MGLNPSLCASMLGVKSQTFRYWRCHLHPCGEQKKFSSSELFTFRVFLFLIRRRGMSVQQLAEQQLQIWFGTFAENEMKYFSTKCIEVNVLDNDFLIKDKNTATDTYNLDLFHLDLRHVVQEHYDAFDNLGR